MPPSLNGWNIGLIFLSEIGAVVIPPESKGLQKWNFLGKMNEEISNEDKQIH
jgi:hypothetical protein